MSEVKHTPVPWRLRTRGNIGNTIEADSGKRYDSLDDGFRVVAMYQECCASDRYLDQRENCDANGAFIVEAVNNYERLKEELATAQATYLQFCKKHDEEKASIRSETIESCAKIAENNGWEATAAQIRDLKEAS